MKFFLNIYGRGGHLGQVTKLTRTLYFPPRPMDALHVIWPDWPNDLGAIFFENNDNNYTPWGPNSLMNIYLQAY